MFQDLKGALGITLMLLASQASADYLTVITFGGVNKDVQKEAFFKPFKAETGTGVVHGSYNGDLEKLKHMIDISHVTWDVVEVEAPELARGCQEGVFEPLTPNVVENSADFVPGAIQPCGIGAFIWSTVLAFDSSRLKSAPAGWADFWDTRSYPGKRGMRWGAKYNLEFALMADGVAPADVYRVLEKPDGVERAFRKLEQLKNNIYWWKAGAEPVRALKDGKVTMTVAYNGRISIARQEQPSIQMVWNGSIYDFDYWAVPKGSWKGDLARRFIGFASQPEPQKNFAEGISYSPVNNKAIPLIRSDILETLPTAPANLAGSVPMNAEFWAKHGAELELRFEEWAGS
ncbi:ABC transporter substrate-binding protein [Pseudomonas sp. GCM10022186]|uniref:ABC transporter substrate-binding protein n=1 Tax=Pseudomonas sp. GCM10022186 TaxID=3252650 RepID=UPI00360C97B9